MSEVNYTPSDALNPTKKFQTEAGWSIIALMGIGISLSVYLLSLLKGEALTQELGIGALLTTVMAGVFIWPGKSLVKEVSLPITVSVGLIIGTLIVLMYEAPHRADSSLTMLSFFTLSQFMVFAYRDKEDLNDSSEVNKLSVIYDTFVWGLSIASTISFVFGAYDAVIRFAWIIGATLLIGIWGRTYVSQKELIDIKRSETNQK